MHPTGTRFYVLLLTVLLASSLGRSESFMGANDPSQSATFTFNVAAGVTNFALNVTNTTDAFSYLLLKRGSTPASGTTTP